MFATIASLIVAALGAAGTGYAWWLNRKTAANTPVQKANAIATRDAQDRVDDEAALQDKDDSKFEQRISE